MKKHILIAAAAVMAGTAAFAVNPDELRIYINPGHGSWTPNDRPMPLVDHPGYSRTNTDTLSFFESNTNLRKGFALLERLREYGLQFDPTLNQTGERWQIGAARDMNNNIVMSHVKCGPYNSDNGTPNQLGDATPANIYYYNRQLTEIVAEVEANNIDYFFSIHSNAATEGTNTNYPVFIYRGYTTPVEEAGVTLDHQTVSRAVSQACWKYAFSNPFMVWTNYSLTNPDIVGDISFQHSSSTNKYGYKGYYGALKHGAPGFLVEGYFHTYQPARHRAMNWDVDAIEGDAYAHGIADYLGLAKEKTGAIYGCLHDKYEKFTHDAYHPNAASVDLYKPINGAKVVLKKDGAQVAEYTTDNYYNGAFVFRHLQPGKYMLVITHPDYNELVSEEIEVKAAETSFAQGLDMINKDYVAPVRTFENYPDYAAEMTGLNAADEYVFGTVYADQAIDGLEGKTVRRAIVRDQKAYILAADADAKNPVVIVYDTKKKEVAANVSLAGLQGSIAPVGDIQVTADGRLMGVNYTLVHNDDGQVQAGETRGRLDIFAWQNDENGLPAGDAEILRSHTTAGLWYRSNAGNTFAYTGTLEDGQGYISAPTAGASGNMRGISFGFANGQCTGSSDMRPTSANVFSGAELGTDYRYITSPADNMQFVVAGQTFGLKAFSFNEYVDKGFVKASADIKPMGQSQMMRYAGKTYMAVPVQTDGNNLGVKLLDLTDGLENATEVKTENTALEAAAATGVAVMAETDAVIDAVTEKVTEAYLALYVLRDGKLTKLSTKGVKQPQNRKEFAYGLKSEYNEATKTYAITFNATGDAPEANLVLTAADAEAIVIPVGAVTKGENNATVDATELKENTQYQWGVELHSKAIANSGEYTADNNGALGVRGSVIPLTDPEYDSFGYVAVSHGTNQGTDVYAPDGTKVKERMHKNHSIWQANTGNQSNPFRGDERDGKVVLAAWGDGAHGISVIDPLDHNTEPAAFYAGTKQSYGHFMYNGVNLGGGVAGLTFVGKGDDTRLYTFSEDHEGGNGKVGTENSVVCYNIGSAWLIETAPEVVGHKALLANTNVDMVSYGDGYFASQIRSAGSNAPGCPVFAYIKHDRVIANSGDLELGASTSAFAISQDGKRAAVGEANRIVILDVEWDGEKPSFSISHTIPTNSTVWATYRFDAAGNLHAYSRDDNGYHAYSLSDPAPVYTTPAKAEYALKGTSSAVANIAADSNDGPVVFYNLQGVQVPADNLVPGVYVKVQGKKSTKVTVK